jgi:hypothetical protein
MTHNYFNTHQVPLLPCMYEAGDQRLSQSTNLLFACSQGFSTYIRRHCRGGRKCAYDNLGDMAGIPSIVASVVIRGFALCPTQGRGCRGHAAFAPKEGGMRYCHQLEQRPDLKSADAHRFELRPSSRRSQNCVMVARSGRPKSSTFFFTNSEPVHRQFADTMRR